MSKTTAVLLILLLITLSILIYFVYAPKQNGIINTLTQTSPSVSIMNPVDANLALKATEPTIQAGQTMTIAVLIHTKNPQTDITQLELAYDPLILTIDSISPGQYFLHPVVALSNIDPVAGRITYALHCSSNKPNTCVSDTSSSLATITLTVNPYSAASETSLTFLPKSIVRTHNGKDILKKTSGLHILISKPINAYASSSAVASQSAEEVPITPAQ